MGVIAHEIGHVLGFWHEQSRTNRDEYVNILTENFDTKYADNFLVRSESQENDYNVSYDYSSNMHYGGTVNTLLSI